jgi:hypothetical protein
MLNSAKLLTLSLIVCVAIMGLPSMASASTIFALSEDGGAYTTIATGASLSSASGSGVFGDFTFKIVGVSTDNSVTLSDLLSSTTSITNNSTASHTISVLVSSQDYTLPVGPDVRIESGMGASLSAGTLVATYQAYADKANGLAGVSDFTMGLQTCSFNVSTCDTGSATGTFTKTEGVYSLTSVANLTLSGGGVANFSTHENVKNVPEPNSLVLIGSSLVLFAGLGFKRKNA